MSKQGRASTSSKGRDRDTEPKPCPCKEWTELLLSTLSNSSQSHHQHSREKINPSQTKLSRNLSRSLPQLIPKQSILKEITVPALPYRSSWSTNAELHQTRGVSCPPLPSHTHSTTRRSSGNAAWICCSCWHEHRAAELGSTTSVTHLGQQQWHGLAPTSPRTHRPNIPSLHSLSQTPGNSPLSSIIFFIFEVISYHHGICILQIISISSMHLCYKDSVRPPDLLTGFLPPWLLILVSLLMSFGASFTAAQHPKSWQGMSLLEIYDLFPLVVKWSPVSCSDRWTCNLLKRPVPPINNTQSTRHSVEISACIITSLIQNVLS